MRHKDLDALLVHIASLCPRGVSSLFRILHIANSIFFLHICCANFISAPPHSCPSSSLSFCRLHFTRCTLYCIFTLFLAILPCKFHYDSSPQLRLLDFVASSYWSMSILEGKSRGLRNEASELNFLPKANSKLEFYKWFLIFFLFQKMEEKFMV